MSVSRNRDIASILGKTEAANASNAALGTAGGGLTVYATLDDLPTTGLTSGDQAYVSSSSRFYISNGSGWYNVALVNATPSLSISPTGTIELSTDGSTTTITLTGTDSDYPDANLTYSVESDGSFGGLATLNQDSSVFTITPLSEDSATTASAVLTFKASDGINFGSGDRTLTLEFKVTNSNYTTLLTKADTTGTDNQVDASSSARTITEVGNVTSAAFTPYHPGGYSTYFDGSGDYLNVTNSTDFDFGTGDFTVEGWYYATDVTGDRYLISFSKVGNTHHGVNFYNGGWRVGVFNDSLITGTTGVEANVWHHFAWVRESGVMKFYIDGTQVGSDVAYATEIACSGTFSIGTYAKSLSYGQYSGYLRDIRIVKGTAVYTSTFTSPTEPLTAIANTSLLACHAPYITDGSTNGNTITVNGSTSTKRFGPYDTLGYTKANHGGSVHFDGTGDYLSASNSTDFDIAGDLSWTIEGWFYWNDISGEQTLVEKFTSGTGPGWTLYIHNSGNIGFYSGSNGAFNNAIDTVKTGQWYHVAVSRDATTDETRAFVNGQLKVNSTYSVGNNSSGNLYIGTRNGSANYMNGYVSDVRVINGTALYTADFTPPTAPLTAITNTQLLTCTNKNDIWNAAEGKQIIKSGSDASNTQRKFATSSAIYFDGTSGLKYDPGVDNLLYNFSTHDWTIEFWFRPNNGAATYTLLSMIKNNSGGLYNTPHIYMLSSSLYYYTDTNNRIIGGTLVSNTWHHFALTRSGNDHKMFLDGTKVGATWTNAYTYAQGRLTLGNYYQSLDTLNPSNIFAGYMQDIRITKGLARYTGNFTPPTAEFDG